MPAASQGSNFHTAWSRSVSWAWSNLVGRNNKALIEVIKECELRIAYSNHECAEKLVDLLEEISGRVDGKGKKIKLKGAKKKNVEHLMKNLKVADTFIKNAVVNLQTSKKGIPKIVFPYILQFFIHHLFSIHENPYPKKKIIVSNVDDLDTINSNKKDCNFKEWNDVFEESKLKISKMDINNDMESEKLKVVKEFCMGEIDQMRKTLAILYPKKKKLQIKTREWNVVKKIIKIEFGELRNYVLDQYLSGKIDERVFEDIEMLNIGTLDIVINLA